MEDWAQDSKKEISISELDEVTKEFVEAKADYDLKKSESNKAHAEMEAKKAALYELLEYSGKTSWETEDGKVSRTEKYQFSTPKSSAQKQELAQYIQDKYGKEMFWDMFSINSMTLQGFTKQELENTDMKTLPGLEEPNVKQNITFRRKAKRSK